MYNKYIGNTGKYIRVDDGHGGGELPARRRPPGPQAPVSSPGPPPGPPAKNRPAPSGRGGGLLGGNLFGPGGLGGLLGGSGGLLGGLSGGLKGMFGNLPFGLDIGDILLFLLLFFVFLESGDEEFLIILAIVAFGIFKDR